MEPGAQGAKTSRFGVVFLLMNLGSKRWQKLIKQKMWEQKFWRKPILGKIEVHFFKMMAYLFPEKPEAIYRIKHNIQLRSETH